MKNAKSSKRRRGHKRKLRFESLETRRLLAVFEVSNVDDLRDAITVADENGEDDVINLLETYYHIEVPDGVRGHSVNEPSGFDVLGTDGKLLLIRGSEQTAKLSVSDADVLRIFNVSAEANLTLENLELHGGYASEGGAIFNRGDLTLVNVDINFSIANYGGAIFNAGRLSVRDSEISSVLSRIAERKGGGIYNVGEVTIQGSQLGGYSKGEGGAIWNGTWPEGAFRRPSASEAAQVGRAEITASTISGSHASCGAGIYNATGRVDLHEVTMTQNFGSAGVGGIVNFGELHLTNSTIIENETGVPGHSPANFYGVEPNRGATQIDDDSQTLTAEDGIPCASLGPVLDKTFGIDGFAAHNWGNEFTIYDYRALTDGKILVIVRTNGEWGIRRLNANGSIDESFANDGLLLVEQLYLPIATELPDGKIFVVGQDVAYRFNRNGTPDLNFGVAGKVNQTFQQVTFSEDGGLFLVRLLNDPETFAIEMRRLTANGQIDQNFGNHGFTTEELGTWEGRTRPSIKFVSQTSNRSFVVLVSRGGWEEELYRFDADGVRDKSFGNAGVVQISHQPGAISRSLAGHNDGSISVFVDDGGTHPTILKYDATGSVDRSFGTNGQVNVSELASRDLRFSSIGAHPGGGYFIRAQDSNGRSKSTYPLIKLHSDGSLDESFGLNGIVDGFPREGRPKIPVLQRDGGILLHTLEGIARYLSFTDTIGEPKLPDITEGTTPPEAVAGPLVRFRVQPTDLAGEELTHVLVGQEFDVNVYVSDLRTAATGVFAAYVDLLFEDAELTFVDDIVFGDAFPNGRESSIKDAMLDEVGAFADPEQNLDAEQFLFSARVRGDTSSTVTFKLDPADESPVHDVLLRGQPDTAVSEELIDFGSFVLNVVPVTWHNPSTPEDVTGDGLVVPMDVLRLINDINANQARQLPVPSLGADGHDFLDVNNDGYVSAIDVLRVVDYLERAGKPVTDPLGEDKVLDIIWNSSSNNLSVGANDLFPDYYTGPQRITELLGTDDVQGTFAVADDGRNVTYTPATDFQGVETIRYIVDNFYEQKITVQVHRPVQDDAYGNLTPNNGGYLLPILANDYFTYRDRNGQLVTVDAVDEITWISKSTLGANVEVQVGPDGEHWLFYESMQPGTEVIEYLADGKYRGYVTLSTGPLYV